VSADLGGRFELAEAHFRDTIARRQALDDRPGEARATGLLGQSMITNGESPEAVAMLEPAAVAFADLGFDSGLVMIEHQLARGHWFAEANIQAAVIADRALGHAERLDDVALIADIMITKGAVISGEGRPYEGLAILGAGYELAREHGLTATMVRGLLNLGASLVGRDTRQSYAYEREAITLSKRLGLRSSLVTATGNAAEVGVRLGEFDWARAGVSELLELGAEIAENDRWQLFRGLAEVRAATGDDPLDLLERFEAASKGDPQTAGNYYGAVAMREFALGHDREAAENWERSSALNTINAPVDLPRAARARLWSDDLEGIKAALASYDDHGFHGPDAIAARHWMHGSIAGLEGRRDEAADRLRQGIAASKDLGLLFELALGAVDIALLLGPDDQLARAAAAEGRATLVSLSATPFIARIDAAMSGATSVPAPTIDTSEPARS
jgi:tetratricopeptide (TPR) repeat protein